MNGNGPTRGQALSTALVAIVALLVLAACCTSPWWGLALLAGLNGR